MYNSSDIQTLEWPYSVRRHPPMYIGDSNVEGFHHMVYEILDNSVDEHLAGFAGEITVTLVSKDEVRIEDNGRGIPVDYHKGEKMSSLEVVLTKLHAGGKFDNQVYKVSGGLHGVGLSVVNALAEYLDVQVYRDGKIYQMRYEKGIQKIDLTEIGTTDKNGTRIQFRPDPEIFDQVSYFSEDVLITKFRQVAFCNPGLRIRFINEIAENPETGENEVEETEFYYENGIAEYLATEMNKDFDVYFKEPLYISQEKDNLLVEIAFQYRIGIGNRNFIESYVNGIHTRQHGLHVDAFFEAFQKVVMSYAERDKLPEKTLKKIDKNTLSAAMTCVVNTRIPGAGFRGQTKDKLISPRGVRTEIRNIVENRLKLIFENNLELVGQIIRKAVAEFDANEKAESEREKERAKKNLSKKNKLSIVAGKLADCSSKDPKKRELFIVEGDSAGGSAKQGRNREIQAILPLRGKILNVQKMDDMDKGQEVLKNNEIKSIIATLGSDYKTTFNLDKIKYHKVVIMTDADIDGSHIRTLLLTFFFQYMRPMIEEGYLYIAQPPLYKISVGKKFYYVFNDAEKDALVFGKLKGKKVDIQRYKGLGEMNPDQLWETTMDPETRKMKRVTINDSVEAENKIRILMGVDTKEKERKKYILKNFESATVIDDVS